MPAEPGPPAKITQSPSANQQGRSIPTPNAPFPFLFAYMPILSRRTHQTPNKRPPPFYRPMIWGPKVSSITPVTSSSWLPRGDSVTMPLAQSDPMNWSPARDMCDSFRTFSSSYSASFSIRPLRQRVRGRSDQQEKVLHEISGRATRVLRRECSHRVLAASLALGGPAPHPPAFCHVGPMVWLSWARDVTRSCFHAPTLSSCCW
jgi:hypothetical protein